MKLIKFYLSKDQGSATAFLVNDDGEKKSLKLIVTPNVLPVVEKLNKQLETTKGIDLGNGFVNILTGVDEIVREGQNEDVARRFSENFFYTIQSYMKNVQQQGQQVEQKQDKPASATSEQEQTTSDSEPESADINWWEIKEPYTIDITKITPTTKGIFVMVEGVLKTENGNTVNVKFYLNKDKMSQNLYAYMEKTNFQQHQLVDCEFRRGKNNVFLSSCKIRDTKTGKEFGFKDEIATEKTDTRKEESADKKQQTVKQNTQDTNVQSKKENPGYKKEGQQKQSYSSHNSKKMAKRFM